MLNPDKRIAKSEGIDIPVLYVYLAGKISGNCIDKCLSWRKKIIDHYRDYKPIYGLIFDDAKDLVGKKTLVGYESYPIAFLDALNSKEADSIDELGLTSALPPKLIYSKDMLSVKKADVLIVNMDDMLEEGIEDLLEIDTSFYCNTALPNTMDNFDWKKAFERLQKTIQNRRSNWGTNIELGWALWLQKPVIIIAGSKKAKSMMEKHPFLREASVIVESVEELLEKKHIQILYKSIASTIY